MSISVDSIRRIGVTVEFIFFQNVYVSSGIKIKLLFYHSYTDKYSNMEYSYFVPLITTDYCRWILHPKRRFQQKVEVTI